MLIFFIVINFCITYIHLRSENSVWQIASAMGLKVKKLLTNSQFELRRILIFFKKSIKRFKNYSLICLFVDGNVYKTANKSTMIYTNQILLCSNWPELSP